MPNPDFFDSLGNPVKIGQIVNFPCVVKGLYPLSEQDKGIPMLELQSKYTNPMGVPVEIGQIHASLVIKDS